MRAGLISLLYVTLISLILFYPATASESNSNAGTRIFDFLKIQMGARPMAMGGAFTGVANDESSLYYNPSGVASLPGKRFIAGYHDNIFDIQSGFLGYMHPVGEFRKLSFYVSYLNYGDFIRTDELGNEGGTFSGSDILFAGGYSMEVSYRFYVGGMIKYIYEKIDQYSATGVAIDLGAKYSFRDERTSVGLMIQNMGVQLGTFVDGGEKESLPTYLRGGISHYLKGLPFLVAADIIYPTDNDLYFCGGAELLSLRPLYLRLGWSNFGSNYKTGSSKDDWAGLSAGFGIEYRRMQISYTFSPQAELGTSHRITLTGGFD
jgi:hypothetical protein